jgi:sugar phosphate permease
MSINLFAGLAISMKILEKRYFFHLTNHFGLSLRHLIMKKILLILLVIGGFLIYTPDALAQCSICNKTVQQMGKGPAKGFNTGIIYLMLIPYAAIGVVGYRWWKNEKTKA